VVIAASIVVAFFSPRDAQFVWILLIGSTRLARVWSNRSPVRSDGDGGGEAMAGGAGSPGEVATSTRLERER
jgi:hypothetical protein